MTLVQRLRAGACALTLSAFAATSAAALDAPKPLSPADARAYAEAFQAVEQGDFVGAEIVAAETSDKSLAGYLSFKALMHPTQHKAGFDELSTWLSRFRDLPVAERVFGLASKRKPADALPATLPAVSGGVNTAKSEVTFPARLAFYSGDVRTALDLAAQVGERWIAGLAAYRLNDYAQAQDYFTQIAQDPEEDAWLRSASAFWASRSAGAQGDVTGSSEFLRLAAQAPQTFYGMIAQRQLQLAANVATTGRLIPAAYTQRQPEPQLARFTSSNERAHRAAALTQIGRFDEARQELRVGLATARTPDDRNLWKTLTRALGAAPVQAARPGYQVLGGSYPIPDFAPATSFTIDRALVYAIAYQESRFNPMAVSPKGAMGLMQLMPASAAEVTGDDRLKSKPSKLFDPAVNLHAGQGYLTWLMERGVGYDLFRTVAAYNGGPGAVQKAISQVGQDDPLLLIECLPAQETRDYVEKVVASYWTYKKMFGEDARSLDAIASGAKLADVRLDLPQALRPEPEFTTQTAQADVIGQLLRAVSTD
jgi:soluble lytic murein transglycosylase-like protein